MVVLKGWTEMVGYRVVDGVAGLAGDGGVVLQVWLEMVGYRVGDGGVAGVAGDGGDGGLVAGNVLEMVMEVGLQDGGGLDVQLLGGDSAGDGCTVKTALEMEDPGLPATEVWQQDLLTMVREQLLRRYAQESLYGRKTIMSLFRINMTVILLGKSDDSGLEFYLV